MSTGGFCRVWRSGSWSPPSSRTSRRGPGSTRSPGVTGASGPSRDGPSGTNGRPRRSAQNTPPEKAIGSGSRTQRPGRVTDARVCAVSPFPAPQPVPSAPVEGPRPVRPSADVKRRPRRPPRHADGRRSFGVHGSSRRGRGSYVTPGRPAISATALTPAASRPRQSLVAAVSVPTRPRRTPLVALRPGRTPARVVAAAEIDPAPPVASRYLLRRRRGHSRWSRACLSAGPKGPAGPGPCAPDALGSA